MLTTKEDKVAIDAKSLGVSSVSLTPVMQLVWAAVLIILLPLACLLCGFVNMDDASKKIIRKISKK